MLQLTNIHKLGISFDENKFKSMDLQHQVQYLSQAMKGHEDQLQHVLGGSKSAALGYNALKTGAAEYGKDLQKLNDAQKNGGAEAQSFAATQQGFNFQMQQAGAAVQVLMIKLGQHLLPVLGQVVGAVAPIINNFIAWEGKTHTLENVLSGIGNAIGLVVGFFQKLVGIGAAVVGFFQHNQTAMDALLSVLGMVALQIASILIPAFIRTGITIFTEVIPGFIAWAIEAGIAAVETLIGFWPIIAAAALVAAAIFIVIEVIQHWGQIGAWLQSAWKAVASFFVGLWSGIVSGLKAAWDAIVSVVRAGAALLLSVIMIPIHAIGALFVWLYGHNTYFKEFVDQIVVIAKAGIALLQAAWQAVVGWLTWLWNGIVSIATTVWNAISSAVMAVVNTVVGWVAAQWTAFIHQLTALWNTLSGLAQTAWNAVVTVFRNIFGPIGAALGNLWNSISSWFGTLATGADNAGKNFISMLVSGIASGAGAIWNAVTGIAKGIWKALGFHSPAEEGPGADADKWMPNLVSMLSSGLIAGMPKIQAAVNVVAKPLAALGSPAPSGVSGPVAAPAASSAGGGTTVINLYTTVNAPALSKREAATLAEVITEEQSRTLRRSGNHITWTSGGKR